MILNYSEQYSDRGKSNDGEARGEGEDRDEDTSEGEGERIGMRPRSKAAWKPQVPSRRGEIGREGIGDGLQEESLWQSGHLRDSGMLESKR
ncbi:hypothetical protein EAI_09108 [Harpegnathos saltator]|uniref:Uncharacterized protein n=1 Tax=Harpegnathos saltator TaxID=610380 RepID=E2B407_HARSA|nr:hypothetical protein EAI_09108 [Harpegnathos saltator]